MLTRSTLTQRVETAIRVGLERAGLQRIESEPADMEPEFLHLYRRCRPYTMTSVERMYAVWTAVHYVARRSIPGAFVECGVWRGGSSMLGALTFAQAGDAERTFYLYDTFEGMAEPTLEDGALARNEWVRHDRDDHNEWCYGPLDEVRANMLSTGLSEARLRLVKGQVEDTIPSTAPGRIAVLRLDTDWYRSTHHELVHLYPLLEPGGILIVDDYGYWEGARRAVDEFFEGHDIAMMLARVDGTGRVAIKLS